MPSKYEVLNTLLNAAPEDFELHFDPELERRNIMNMNSISLRVLVEQPSEGEIPLYDGTRIFNLLDAIATSGAENTNPDFHVEGSITSALIVDGIACVESNDVWCIYWFMNPREYAAVLKSLDKKLVPEIRKTLDADLPVHVWGMQIIVRPDVPVGNTYLCCTPEDLGRIAVQADGQIGVGTLEPRGFARILFPDP